MDEKLRLLVVDDHQSMQLVLLNVLKKKYQVTVADDGYEALSAIKNEVPDIVLLDYQLPELDGLSFLNYLKKSLVFKNIPVIMLTGAEEQELQDACKQVGAYAVLHKPFNPDDLFNTLNKISKEHLHHN